MHISIRHSQDHHEREGFRPYVDGQHAILLQDSIIYPDYGHRIPVSVRNREIDPFIEELIGK